MSMTEAYIADRFRDAAFTEVRDSEARVMGDLHQLFTAGLLEDSIQVNFGDDRALFDKTIDVLDIENLLKQPDNGIDIVAALTAHHGSTGYLGQSIFKTLEALPIGTALEAMHADRWRIEKDFGIYTKLRFSEGIVVSEILCANFTDGEGYHESAPKDIDKTKLGIVLGLNSQYVPEVSDPVEVYEPDLAARLDSLTRGNRSSSEVVANLAQWLSDYEYELTMPSRNYFLRAGALAVSGMFGGGLDVVSAYGNRYQVINGRVMRIPEQLELDEAEEAAELAAMTDN